MLTNHEDKVASHNVVPIIHVDDTEEALTPSAGGSIHSSLSGTPRGNEGSDGEIESVTSEPRLQVGSYQIKESFASILHSILDKYGDIGASCHLESVAVRSYYIECVCFVVQELQSASIMQLSKSKVKELLAIIKDVESAQLRVAWLRSALDELAENIELINHHQEVEAEKDNSGRQVESLREELESELETLAQKEQEVANIKTRIPQITGRLSELELQASELNKSMLSIKSKVDNLHIKSLVDELL
ncbi:Phospholipase protein [Spatholobus suberectus]|nr:Phospholipase protein [Spatholobus suberectus]